MTSPEAAWNPQICDVERREKVLKLALLLERVHVVHGLGAVSMAHFFLMPRITRSAARFTAKVMMKRRTPVRKRTR